VDNQNTFPIDRLNQARYIAVRDKLYKEQEIVHQPPTPFNQQLLDKQEAERKQKLVYVSVSGDHLKRGYKSDLLTSSYWNND